MLALITVNSLTAGKHSILDLTKGMRMRSSISKESRHGPQLLQDRIKKFPPVPTPVHKLLFLEISQRAADCAKRGILILGNKEARTEC